MNDDFLRRAWRRPPAEFTNQLRERLREQELTQASRRRPNWRLLAVLLLIGGAAAAMYLTGRDVPLLAFFSTEQRQTSSPTAARTSESTNSGAGYRARYASPSGTPTRSTDTQPSSLGARDLLSSSDGDSAAVADSNSSSMLATGNSGVSTGTGSATATGVHVMVANNIAKLTADVSWSSYYGPAARLEAVSSDTALRELCAKGSANAADVAIVARRITTDELKSCKEGPGDGGVLEAKLAHMAIVIARAKGGSSIPISPDTIWRALLKKVPSPDDPYRLIDNPYTSWHQIDRSAEDLRIEVIGPPRDSDEFRMFAAVILEPACERWLQTLQGVEHSDYEKTCRMLREDGAYVEAPLDNTFIRQRLWSNPNLVAIVDYRFYSASRDDFAGSLLGGAPPTRESLVNGSYPGARSIYFYVNAERRKRVPVATFVREFLRRHDPGSNRLVPADGDLEWRWDPEPLKLTEAIPQ